MVNCEYEARCKIEECSVDDVEDCNQYWLFRIEDLQNYVTRKKQELERLGLFEECRYEHRGRKNDT